MRILFIRPSNIYVTPAFSRVVEAKGLLDNPKVEIHVLHWVDSDSEFKSDGIKYHNFSSSKGKLGFLKWNLFILKTLLMLKPGFVHNFSFQNWFPIVLYKLFYPKRIKLFYDCRDYFAWSASWNPVLKRFMHFFDRRISRLCSQIIFPDPNGYTYFRTKAANFSVIPNTVIDTFKNRELIRKSTGDRIKILYAGYLSNDRNIQAIIDAVKKFQHLELNIATNFISSQFDQSLLEDPRFIYHGKLSHQQVIDLMLECDYSLIMYNPSLQNYQQIQPTKFYDSLMSNTPFICAEGMTSLQKYCGSDWPNICLPYNDVDAFTQLKKPLINDKNRSLYTDTYEYSKVLSDLAKVYDVYLGQ